MSNAVQKWNRDWYTGGMRTEADKRGLRREMGVSSHAAGAAQPDASLPDAALVTAAQQGDAAAFDALVVRHQDRVYGLALRLVSNREDALEVAQDAFVRAHGALAEFREEAAFATWLYRIVVNLARNRLRDRQRKGRNLAVSLEALRDMIPGHELPAPIASNPRAVAERGEMEALLQEALASLAPPYREAFVLRVYDELPYEAIAAVMACPVGTVRSRLNGARRQLHAWLTERGAL